MDITLFIDYLLGWWQQCASALNTVKIGNGIGVEIGLFSFFLTLIVFAIAVGVLWKGAKK